MFGYVFDRGVKYDWGKRLNNRDPLLNGEKWLTNCMCQYTKDQHGLAMPKRNDGKYDIVLAVGGTHLYLNSDTVFSELKLAADAVHCEIFKLKDGCYQ